MKKSKMLLPLVMALLMVFSTAIYASAEATQFNKSIQSSEFKLNMPAHTEESTQNSFSFHLEDFDSNDFQVQNFKRQSKILDPLKANLNDKSLNSQDRMEVSVMLKHDSKLSKNEFIQKNAELLNEKITDINGFGVYGFFANLSAPEIERLAQLEDVSTISTTNDVVSVYGMPSEDQDQFETYLNGATEMTGIKKARSDYGVTGNRDGSSGYSKNDSVIAIIDTGVDSNHVDLRGGKVIGWKDFVNPSSTTAYDNLGHGTHVASIAAGAGTGETGVAPGAAIVGIKVCATNTSCSFQNILEAMDWAIQNKTNLGIDIINLSLGSSGAADPQFCSRVSSAASKGMLTVVAAGNTSGGAKYNSLNRLGKCSGVLSVANLADPNEGGWYLNPSSNRGVGNERPSLAAPGTNIRAAKANSTNQYISYTGTSMAAPMVAGLAALMLEASNGNTNYDFKTEDYGMSGSDKAYGNGLVLGHETIKAAAGSSAGSFNNDRQHLRMQSSIAAGAVDLYEVNVTNTEAFFANTLVIDNENGADLDLFIWAPGVDPMQNGELNMDQALRSSTGLLPQEMISFKPLTTGTYTVGVVAYSPATYAIDWVGQISSP